MSIRKLIPLAGLVLAIAALSPASALAKEGGPLKGTVSGTTSLSIETGEFTSTVTGRASQGGKYTRIAKGTVNLLTGEAHGAFNVTILSNGAQLYGEFDATTTPEGEQLVDVDIQGGTGQFDGVCGTVTETDQLTPISIIGTTELLSREGTFTGQTSYDCP